MGVQGNPYSVTPKTKGVFVQWASKETHIVSPQKQREGASGGTVGSPGIRIQVHVS